MPSVIRGSGNSSLGGNLDIEGVLTYEDVTSVDSVGVITARSGAHIGTGASVFSPASNHLTLGTNDVERLRINSVGRVGIGTTSPRDPVHIFHPTNNVNLLIESGDANAYLAFRDNDTTSDTAVYLGAEGNNLKFITSGQERLRITGIGSVGIGITNPDTKLHLATNSSPAQGANYAALSLGSPTQPLRKVEIGARRSTSGNDWDHVGIGFKVHASNDHTVAPELKMVLDYTGYLGIGTDTYDNVSPLVPLHVCRYSPTTTITTHGELRSASQLLLQTSNNVNNSRSGVMFTGALHSTDGCGAGIIANHEDVGENSETTSLSVYTTHNESLKESFTISSQGYVNKQYQPLAIIGTSENNYNPSVGDILPFDWVSVNRGNHYDTTNYRFVCPVDGDYMCILHHSKMRWVGDVYFEKNGSIIRQLEMRASGRNAAGNADWEVATYAFIVPCSANDQLRYKVGANNTAIASNPYILDGVNHTKYDSATYYLMG